MSVLRYTKKKISATKARRHYLKWRESQGIPVRCDEPLCRFHTEPLIWNGKPFKLVLDHKNGVNSYNRGENLQLLCPNCDSQLRTRGGGNKGKVKKEEGGFAKKHGEIWHYTVPADVGGKYQVSGQATSFRYEPVAPRGPDRDKG
jgi:hypothetical protein